MNKRIMSLFLMVLSLILFIALALPIKVHAGQIAGIKAGMGPFGPACECPSKPHNCGCWIIK